MTARAAALRSRGRPATPHFAASSHRSEARDSPAPATPRAVIRLFVSAQCCDDNDDERNIDRYRLR